MSLLGAEVKDKKQLVYGSRHRVNGSRSKKCSLPSDGLSDAKWKKLNGEVLTVNMNKPMAHMEFEALTPDLQREYIISLREKYGAGKAHIRKMLGVGQHKMDKILDRLDISGFPTGGAGKMTAEQRDAWGQFLLGGGHQSDGSSPAIEPQADIPPENGELRDLKSVEILHGKITLSGEVSSICNTLLNILGSRTRAETMTVEFSVEGVSREKCL